MARDQREDGADGPFDRIGMGKDVLAQLIEEIFFRELSRHVMRAPSLVIKSTNDERQLGAKVDAFLKRETVPELVQHGPQHAVSGGLVGQLTFCLSAL